MRDSNRRTTRSAIRRTWPDHLLGGRKRARLVRFDDAMTAEDDYYRFANRNR